MAIHRRLIIVIVAFLVCTDANGEASKYVTFPAALESAINDVLPCPHGIKLVLERKYKEENGLVYNARIRAKYIKRVCSDLITLNLSWDAPIARENGDALQPGDLSHYEIYTTQSAASPINDHLISIDYPATSTTADLPPGHYFIGIVAVDKDGLKSSMGISDQKSGMGISY